MFDEHGDYIEPPRYGLGYWLKAGALSLTLLITASECFRRGTGVFGAIFLTASQLNLVSSYWHSQRSSEGD